MQACATAQLPPWQAKPAQQNVLAHDWPCPAHMGLGALHTPPSQVSPAQHFAKKPQLVRSPEQDKESCVQRPATQLSEQQSEPRVQASPP